MSLDYTQRSATCGGLTEADAGREILLAGWVRHRRDLGGLIFIRLGDRYGETQLVADPAEDPAAAETASACKLEYAIVVRGVVRLRPDDQVRSDQPTGAVEVLARELTILSPSKPLPFPLTDEAQAGEELRLKHRYLDLRRRPMMDALVFRHRFLLAMRNWLSNQGFLEVETPILTRSTPEGARDYLVPSRVYPGNFFALPQSPQMYKQLLMVAGVDRYFQIARCFRDEDARSDRQAEFTQLDLEMSFAGAGEVQEVSEGLFHHLWKETLDLELPIPWPRLPYVEAIARYGCDKPDTRFELELTTLEPAFADTELTFVRQALAAGGTVRGILVPGQTGASRGQLAAWENIAKSAGAGGLLWARWTGEGFASSIAKFLSPAARDKLRELSGAREGDLLLAAAGTTSRVNTSLSRLRLQLGEELKLIPDGRWNFCWVTEFPLFERDEEGRLTSAHHPFTMPHPDDIPLIRENPERVRSASYDIVVNGVEIASGSPRIHDRQLQNLIFETLGLSEETIRSRFGYFLEGLSYGTPPHAGIAPGIDRLLSLMLGRESIREVIAFPKTLKAFDPLTGAPSDVDESQMIELGLALRPTAK